MRYLFSTSEGLWVVQRTPGPFRCTALFRPLAVLLNALPSGVLSHHGKDGGAHDRSV